MEGYSASESDDADNPLNRSVEKQIHEAKKRVELYSQTLQQSREQELKALQRLEEERSRWMNEFEKKSLIINELERELQSTVETLEQERGEQPTSTTVPNFLPRAASDPLLLRTTGGLRGVSHHLPQATRLSDEEIENEFRQLLRHDHSSNATNLRVGSGGVGTTQREELPSGPGETGTIWNELLNQYKEQLKKLKQENVAIFQEKQQLQRQNQEYLNQIQHLQSEQEQYKIAVQDFEGKYSFRTRQVQQLEEENEAKQSRIVELVEEKEHFERLVRSLQQEIASLTTESTQQIQQLQKKIVKISDNSRENELEQLLEAKDQQIASLQQQLKQTEERYSQELIETKQMVSSLSLRLKNLSASSGGNGESPHFNPSVSEGLPYLGVSESSPTLSLSKRISKDFSGSNSEPLLQQMKSLNSSLQHSWVESKRQVEQEEQEQMNKSIDSVDTAGRKGDGNGGYHAMDVYPMATNILQNLETKLKSPPNTPSRKKTTSSAHHHHHHRSTNSTIESVEQTEAPRVANENEIKTSQPPSTAAGEPLRRSFDDLVPTLQKSSLGRRDRGTEPSFSKATISPSKTRPSLTSVPSKGTPQSLLMPSSHRAEKPFPPSNSLAANFPQQIAGRERHDEENDEAEIPVSNSPRWKQPTIMKVSIKKSSSSEKIERVNGTAARAPTKEEPQISQRSKKPSSASPSPARGTRLSAVTSTRRGERREDLRQSSFHATISQVKYPRQSNLSENPNRIIVDADNAAKPARLVVDTPSVSAPISSGILSRSFDRSGDVDHIQQLNPTIAVKQNTEKQEKIVQKKKVTKSLKKKKEIAHTASKFVTDTQAASTKTTNNTSFTSTKSNTTSHSHSSVKKEGRPAESFVQKKKIFSVTLPSHGSTALNTSEASIEQARLDISRKSLETLSQHDSDAEEDDHDDEGEVDGHPQSKLGSRHHSAYSAPEAPPPTKIFAKKFTKPQISAHILKPTLNAVRRKEEVLEHAHTKTYLATKSSEIPRAGSRRQQQQQQHQHPKTATAMSRKRSNSAPH